MDPNVEDKNNEEKPGFFYFLRRLFFKMYYLQKEKMLTPGKDKEIHLEPKYWSEVRELMGTLHNIIETHTTQEENIRIINQRILDYIEEQINVKGSIEDIEERYSALDTLADRILVKNLDKIVGLKHEGSTHAEFSEAIRHFKNRLHQRRQEEILAHQERKKQ